MPETRPTIGPPPEPAEAETAARLPSLLQAQRLAFARGVPDYRQRMNALQALRDALHGRQEALAAAVAEDFGGRAREETLLLELFPLFDQIRHARRHLKRWMRRRPVAGSWFLLPSRAFVLHQPLGVIGVIGAWNYQLLLTLGPLIDALAAGNHAIVKPSEVAPRSAAAIASVIADTFPPEYVACVTGGPAVASAFSALPFDHLFYTGSARVGRLVMQSAAANLTPVTLELGGKSPAIVHESYSLPRAVRRIVTAKLFNAGQTCLAPDYVLLPEGLEGEFERLAVAHAAGLYPRIGDNPDYTRIVDSRQFERLQAALRDAEAKGARIVTVNPARESLAPGDRVLPPTFVFRPSDDMIVMREEIFGPVLPVVGYRTLDEAIARVNDRPRPLALYYFDNKRERIEQVLARTMSGGVTLNDCLYHIAQHNLPFGGVGASGMGHYHGRDGFLTFSKQRGVMVQRRWAATAILGPPFAGKSRLIEALLRLARR